MGGIKIHAAIDTLIARNRIHNTGRALWMDWMAQGTRITRNLCYDNTTDDLFVEVNHGPFLVDNNLFLSPTSLRDWSEGGAFAHNLFGGRVDSRPELKRDTPYHPAHSTVVAGLRNIAGGDHRFFNNVFVGTPSAAPATRDVDPKTAPPAATYGLATYQTAERPLLTGWQRLLQRRVTLRQRGGLRGGNRRQYRPQTRRGRRPRFPSVNARRGIEIRRDLASHDGATRHHHGVKARL